MNKRNNPLPWLIGGAIVLIILCCFCIIAVAIISSTFSGGNSEIPTIPRVEQVAPVQEGAATATPRPLPQAAPGVDLETEIYTRVYERVNPSVVAVRVLDRSVLENSPDSEIQPFFLNTGEGSGFVIDSEGHIITNRHVVVDAASVVVQFSDGIEVPADVIGTDTDTDLAVLKIDPRGLNLAPVQFGSIDDLTVGARVMVIGNPFGNANTLTTGIISALGRDLALPNTQFRLPEVIQTDAAINPGNSGGPMLNANGEVIGVAFMLQSFTQSNAGIGFGIPVYFVERVSRAIIETGSFQHTWLGIRGNTLSPFEIREFNLGVEAGALVQEVVPDGPADKAGLRGGDESVTIEGVPFLLGGDIIIAIDGQPVRAFEDLLAYLGRYAEPGLQVTLTLVRDGETIDIPVTLEPRPE